MFVKTGTGFKKLLDKKSLRIAAYGDSKGLKFLRKFNPEILIIGCILLKYDLVLVHQPKLGLCHLLYVFFGIYILLILLQFNLALLLGFYLDRKSVV